MSYQATSWAARQTTGNSGRKALLLLIANHANAAGYCWPGRKSLAVEAECRPETVSANLGALEAAGLIARFERRRKNGSKTTDWIVLAPGAVDRGEMHDADPDEVPAYISVAASRGSGWDISPEVSGPGQVRKTGSPEPVNEQAIEGCEGARAKLRISGKPVDAERWALTERVLAEFNAQADRKLRLLTSAGQPSEAAKRVYGRVATYVDLSFDELADIIRRTLVSRWWGKDPPTIGVVFGPNVFEENITRKVSSEQAAKVEADRERAERERLDAEAIERLMRGRE